MERNIGELRVLEEDAEDRQDDKNGDGSSGQLTLEEGKTEMRKMI